MFFPMTPGYMGYMIISLIVVAITGLASQRVKSTFKRFSKVPLRRRLSGAQAARLVLDANGLQNVAIERVAGKLTDHYDPRTKVLRLSEPVYAQPTLAAVGVATHEAGHAIQDKDGYLPLKLRQSMIPLANFGSNIGLYILIFGLIFAPMLGYVGLALFSLGVLASIVTLPVEFNASSRALAQLSQQGIVTEEEYFGTKKVLNAAAMTYLAATFGAVLTLLYWMSIVMGSNRD